MYLTANSPADIDALHNKRIKVVPLHGGNDHCSQEIAWISPEIRSMVENSCYMSVYGHRSLFEQRVPKGQRAPFNEFTLKVAKDNENEFYESWKRYSAASPTVSRV